MKLIQLTVVSAFAALVIGLGAAGRLDNQTTPLSRSVAPSPGLENVPQVRLAARADSAATAFAIPVSARLGGAVQEEDWPGKTVCGGSTFLGPDDICFVVPDIRCYQVDGVVTDCVVWPAEGTPEPKPEDGKAPELPWGS